ncbi:class A sortase [Enterococcus sp. AZ196]|uniref:class A sortase n=1 Tax=Enterococcus sp. AZ196 TaxID=2774659 RepID=UPI003D2BB154
MKKAWKSLPILWLVLGFVLACGSGYGYHLMKNAGSNAEQMTHQIEPKKTSQKRIKQKTNEATYDENQIKPVTPDAFAQAQLRYEKIVNQWGIGSLYIPSANVRTKILAGMDNQSLMVGVGTYSPTQQFGKGNYVVLAHNLVQGGGSLGNLPKTELNQVFYATDFAYVYEYVARKNAVVNQSEGELLEEPEKSDEALMTLIRCEGGLNTDQRAIVQGTFVKRYPADQASAEVKLGLGLIEEKMTEVGPSDPTVDSSSDVFSQKRKQSHKKTAEQPIYSPLQRVCISAFAWLNQSPVLIAIGYLVILSLLIKGSTLITL